jgi:hypothetical protein
MGNNLNYNKLLIRLLIILCIIASILFIVDSSRIKNGNQSIFTFPIVYYKDGGTIYKIGIGYGVYEWRICTNRIINGVEISGDLVGNEIVGFPKCYYVIFSHNIKPKIELKFESY